MPGIPDTVEEQLRRSGVLNQKNLLTNIADRDHNRILQDVDRAARVGLRYLSALMLVAEVITMSYERAHEGGVSRKDTGAMVALMARLRDYS